MITLATLQRWLISPAEHEQLEFKEARQQFDSEKLMRYCVALANERGGHLIMGITDKTPRRVVGRSAFASPQELNSMKVRIATRLKIRVETVELLHPAYVESVIARALWRAGVKVGNGFPHYRGSERSRSDQSGRFRDAFQPLRALPPLLGMSALTQSQAQTQKCRKRFTLSGLSALTQTVHSQESSGCRGAGGCRRSRSRWSSAARACASSRGRSLGARPSLLVALAPARWVSIGD